MNFEKSSNGNGQKNDRFSNPSEPNDFSYLNVKKKTKETEKYNGGRESKKYLPCPERLLQGGPTSNGSMNTSFHPHRIFMCG